MTSTTVFNVTEHPVRISAAGNRVPGRTSTEVTDTADTHYIAALERGDLVVLSATAAPAPVVVAEPAPEPEPMPAAPEDEVPAEAEAEETASAEPKKKPTKAKEN